MHPINDLAQEHGPIKLMLRVLEKINYKIAKGETIVNSDLNNVIIFLREFADKCHHGKEENLLFPMMKQNGILKDIELVDILIAEHDQGRTCIRNINEAIAKQETNRAEFAEIFTTNAKNYIALLDQHIDKENSVLFPEAKQTLSKNQLKELEEGFENLEKNIIGEGRHEELHNIIHMLKEAYL